MSARDPGAGSRKAGAGKTAGGVAAGKPAPWMLRQKVTIPERAAGYLHRPELVERAMPTLRRVTVLKAPGGFGKTTLLAECCRGLRRDGVPTAWVSLDGQDEPEVLDTYIAFACRSAGLEGAEDPGPGGAGPANRVGLVLQGIEALDGPFVLAFDEPDRLNNPDAVALLDFLVQRGPPNLHLAFACRELPVGVNIAGAMLEGHAGIVTADELRFSEAQVAEFFGSDLSRGELAAVMVASAGWPFALRIARNEMESGAPGGARITQEFVENWVESRLFAGLGPDDREFLLDIGLFEWIDAALLDEVLQRSDSLRRIESIPVLAGLLQPVSGETMDSWRLHPLIREHCVRRSFRATPERFRAIHRRIALALTRRGETVAAMRHAVEAGDAELAGDILEGAGGALLHARQGPGQYLAADRWLSEEVVSKRPRLALFRCLALVLSGRLGEARRSYAAVAATLPAGDDDLSDDGFQLSVDDCAVRGSLAHYGSERMGSAWMRRAIADYSRLAASPRVDPATCGHLEYGLCMARNMTAAFESALDHAARARRHLGDNPYLTLYIDAQVGQIAMAQGRVREAEEHYVIAQRMVKTSGVFDPVPAGIVKVLRQELALECGRRMTVADLPDVPDVLVTGATPFLSYAAAAGAVVELRLQDEGIDGALRAADGMLDYVRGAGLPALIRYLSASRVSLLATAGRIGEAERAWQADDLPETPAGCLDLDGQSWREMEALSCAQLRLSIARERFDAARGFARDLRAAAEARGLRRTLMRALALSMALEQRAGGEAAAGHLADYLRLFAETPYAGAVVREPDACGSVLESYLDAPSGRRARQRDRVTAEALMAAIDRTANGPYPVLGAREREVLERLGHQRDKEIADALGLTTHGVRYYLRGLFSKLEVRSRADAVRRARELGLIDGTFGASAERE